MVPYCSVYATCGDGSEFVTAVIALSIFWVGGRLRYAYPRDLSHGGGSWVLI